ncbi:MAG: hypothetical protein AAFX79_06200 [Planctomycetota bacterium]
MQSRGLGSSSSKLRSEHESRPFSGLTVEQSKKRKGDGYKSDYKR